MLVQPMSGPGAGCASGGVPGQTGMCTGSGEGRKSSARACEPAHASTSRKITRIDFTGHRRVTALPIPRCASGNIGPSRQEGGPAFWHIDGAILLNYGGTKHASAAFKSGRHARKVSSNADIATHSPLFVRTCGGTRARWFLIGAPGARWRCESAIRTDRARQRQLPGTDIDPG